MRQRFWQGTFKTLGLLGLTAGLAAQAAEPSGKASAPPPACPGRRSSPTAAPRTTPPRKPPRAYLLARDLGADYLEADVQRSRDGVLVALHDDTLERTTGRRRGLPGARQGPVSSFTLAELKRLDAGSWFKSRLPRARPARLRRPAHPHPRRDARHRRGRRQQAGPVPGDQGTGAIPRHRRRPAQAAGTPRLAATPRARRRRACRRGPRQWPGDPADLREEQPGTAARKACRKWPKILLLWLGDGYLEAPFASDLQRNPGNRQGGLLWPGRK
ncbi:glycerophosphodiester phosphodiesterase [Pseudomonas aeruginosa]|nr:glycerophosphodiester phosphodiesterase [Pseudomonas aeruginosa]